MNCIFCKIANKEIPSKLLYEDDLVMAFLDVNPNVDGHTLIIPKEHYQDFTFLPDDILTHINKVVKELTPKLLTKLNSQALSLTTNYGDAQEVKHFHLHVIPNLRCHKPSKTIEETYELLKP